MFICIKFTSNKFNFIFHNTTSSNFFKKKDHVSNITSQVSSSSIASDKKVNMCSDIFPYNDILTKEIELWQSYAECLRKKDRELFNTMLKNCYKYSQAINAKGKYYSTVSILMTILLEHHKIILNNKIEKNKIINYDIDYVYHNGNNNNDN
ncbi:MAG: hypothetical protein ACPKQO_00650 [Nitrososphaeraceae archaeon]